MDVRAVLTDRVHHVRASFGIALQAAVAAGLAWFIAHRILHHPFPFFAPISAVLVLAVSIGQRLRRAIEVVIGNAFGILFGEALIIVIGRGSWQVGIAVLIAILGAILLGGSAALVGQAASSSVLVVTFTPVGGEYFLSRFVDALVGGTVGLTVMALLLPLNPLTVVSRAAGPVLDTLAKGLSDTADALTARDAAAAQRALSEMRDAEAHLRGLDDAINAGKEISLFAPIRWGRRGALSQYVDGYNHIARALRNSRVLVRRSVTAIEDAEPLPPALASAVHSLADSASWLRRDLAAGSEPLAPRDAALRAVNAAGQAYLVGLGFSGSVIVAQIRSGANDLLRASGVDPDETARQVRKAVGKASAVNPAPKISVPRPEGQTP